MSSFLKNDQASFYDDEILTQNLLRSSFVVDDEKSISNFDDPVASSTAQKQKIALDDSLISLRQDNDEKDNSKFDADLISFVDENGPTIDEQSLISNFSVDSELLKIPEPSWKKTFLGEEFSLKEIGDKNEFFRAEEAKNIKNHPFIQGVDTKNCDTSAWSLGPSSLSDDSRFSAISRTAYFGAGSQPLGTPCFEKTSLEQPCRPKNNSSRMNETENISNFSSKNLNFNSENSNFDSKNRQSEICFDEIRRIIDQIPNSENVSVLVETILKAKNELQQRKQKPSILTSLENRQKIDENVQKSSLENEIQENSTNRGKFSLEKDNPSTPHCNLFTNKRLLSFGCTELSEKSLQYFSLKNNSQSEILRFKLTLHQRRGDENPENNNFQVVNPDADGYVLLHPRETLPIKILFKPDEVKFYNAKILISTVNHPQRLCIPIFGYGGSCSLSLRNFPLTKKAFHDVNFDLHRRKTRIFQLYNKGSLAGFFNILLYEDPSCSTFFRGKNIQVHPIRGVIPSGQSMDVTVTVDCTDSLPILGNALGHIVICYGEEISRQRLKKWESVKCKNFLIKEQSFTREKFENEENNDENLYRSEDPQQAVVREEAQLFLGHLREIHCRLSPSPELYNDDSSFGSSFFPIPLDNSHLAVGKIFFKKPQTPPPAARCSLSSTFGRHFGSLTDIVNSPKLMHTLHNEPNGSITVAPKMIKFVDTNANARDTVRIEFKNNSTDSSNTIFLNVDNHQDAFNVNCPQYRLDARKLVRIAVHFEPKVADVEFSSILHVRTSNGQSIDIPLRGKSLL